MNGLMTRTCLTTLSLVVLVILALISATACEESTPSRDSEFSAVATVQSTIIAGSPTVSVTTSISTQTPTPEPDLEATVQAMVLAVLPTATPTVTPDLPATIEAGVAATVAAIPTNTSTATSTPSPTPTASIPTTTPVPIATHSPTATVIPTPTLSQMVEAIKLSIAYIETADGGGTGFIVDEDGLLVTNAHVVNDSLTVNVVFEDGNEYDGNVLGVDERADLAIVKLRADRKFSAMGLGNSDDVDVGDEVIALGFPLSYELGSSLTVTRGIISAKRSFEGVERFQTDAALNPGNSGGPLVSRDGKVVGVNYAELAMSDGSPVDNIGFSIAINELKRRLASLRSGENELFPTPTPGLWSTYRNEDYGYQLETAPDWSLDEETEDGNATFWTEDSTGILKVIIRELRRNSTLEELADSERNLFEELSLQESWNLLETKAFQRREERGREYYHFAYRRQSSDEYCVTDGISRIFVSDFYPSKPYGFVVRISVCERSLDRYAAERDEMLSSFADSDTFPPTPTPVPWITLRNERYGYRLDVPPDLTEAEETNDNVVTMVSGGGQSLFTILALDLGEQLDLKMMAEIWRDVLTESARDDGWVLFEILSLQKEQSRGDEFYHLHYRRQKTDDSCVEDGITRILLSDSYPSKPFGFVVGGQICEDSLDLYEDTRREMIESFGAR